MFFVIPGQTPSQKVLFIIESVFLKSPKIRRGVSLNAGCFSKLPPKSSRVPMFRALRALTKSFRVTGLSDFTVKANPNQEGSLFGVGSGKIRNS